jgi:nitroreductase
VELREALRTTGSVRRFAERPVNDDTLFAILDDARFAPSGGNRQAWRVIVVHDAAIKKAIGDAYLDAWHDYVAHVLAGLIPFSPLASDADRHAAATQRAHAEKTSKADGFAETFGLAPAMLVVAADMHCLAATDRDLTRYGLVGGASVYPFVWNLLLAAREHDLGGVMTTVATRNEPALRDLLHLPATHAVAAVVILGHPEKRHTHLRRHEVGEFTTVDAFDGPRFAATSPLASGV